MGSIKPDFEGETVVVTGGTSGIGREVALRFGDAGASVIIGDIETDPKDIGEDIPTHELIREKGGKAEFVKTDVRERNQIKDLVGKAHEYGGVDVMVNNAGVFIEGSILDLSPEDFEKIHEVNSRGAFFGTQIAANDMLDRKEPGVILNTASISQAYAQLKQVQYDSSKGSIKMITRGAALELAEEDIRVNGVAPGQIATEFVDGLTKEKREMAESQEFIKPIPLGRAGEVEDVAGAYLFLASEEASYITGEIIYVDGGWQVF